MHVAAVRRQRRKKSRRIKGRTSRKAGEGEDADARSKNQREGALQEDAAKQEAVQRAGRRGKHVQEPRKYEEVVEGAEVEDLDAGAMSHGYASGEDAQHHVASVSSSNQYRLVRAHGRRHDEDDDDLDVEDMSDQTGLTEKNLPSKRRKRRKSDKGLDVEYMSDQTGLTEEVTPRKQRKRRKSDEGLDVEGMSDQTGLTEEDTLTKRRERRKSEAGDPIGVMSDQTVLTEEETRRKGRKSKAGDLIEVMEKFLEEYNKAELKSLKLQNQMLETVTKLTRTMLEKNLFGNRKI